MRSQRAEAGAAGSPPAETLDELATLRLAIVQEYPNLYRGRRDAELKYLRHYAATTDVCIILVADGGSRMIGVATGLPLIHAESFWPDGTPYPVPSVASYSSLSCDPVERPDDHLLRPPGYLPSIPAIFPHRYCSYPQRSIFRFCPHGSAMPSDPFVQRDDRQHDGADSHGRKPGLAGSVFLNETDDGMDEGRAEDCDGKGGVISSRLGMQAGTSVFY